MGSYLSIITLNVNGLNASTKNKDWLNGCMLSKRGPPRNRGHIQTESEGLEKIFHANRDQKKTGVAIFISDKIDFKTKSEKRQRKALHDDQRINLRRRYNNYKYICTQNRTTTICKTNANKYERRN